MADAHGFDAISVGGRAVLRCSVCDVQGEPWEWPLHRRYQHAQMHAGITVAAARDRELSERREELKATAMAQSHRDRRVVLPPRRCANPYCSAVFQPRRSTARYCSGACRVAEHRRRRRAKSTP